MGLAPPVSTDAGSATLQVSACPAWMGSTSMGQPAHLAQYNVLSAIQPSVSLVRSGTILHQEHARAVNLHAKCV